MKTIALADIVIPENRQRRVFDETQLNELAKDLLRPHGLLHPIVLRNDGKTLVSGERRLRAIQLLTQPYTHQGESIPPTHVPYITLAELAPDELEEAELSENIRRVDLSWQEKTEAIARLHDLRSRQNPNQTAKATLAEIRGVPEEEIPAGLPSQVVTNAVLLQENLHRESVRHASSEKEAMRNLKKELEMEFRAALAETELRKGNTSEHTVIHGDFREKLPGLPKAHLIIADPPYGISADNFGDKCPGHTYGDDKDSALGLIEALCDMLNDATAPLAHLYLFCDVRQFFSLLPLVEAQGWNCQQTPLIWYKTSTRGAAPKLDFTHRRAYECMLFAVRGDRALNYVANDVLEFQPLRDKIHGAQKPVALYQELMRRSALPGEIVLDPFCGTGTVFPAATRQSLRAIGIELDESYYKHSLSRISGEE